MTTPTPIRHKRRRTVRDVLEQLLHAAVQVEPALDNDGTQIIHGARDKRPEGALCLTFDNGQVFYVDVQEADR